MSLAAFAGAATAAGAVGVRSGAGVSSARAAFGDRTKTSGNDTANGFARLRMFRQRSVLHTLFDFHIAWLLSRLGRDDFVNVGRHGSII